MRAAFRETIDGLLEGGVDLFQFETFSLLAHLAIAIEEARDASADLPIVAMLTFGEDVEAARRHPNPSGGPTSSTPWRRCRRRELRGRAAGLPRRPHRHGRDRSRDHPQRRPAAADRGPVRLRRPADYLAAMTPRFIDAGARSSAAAAGRPRTTSGRCARRSMPWRPTGQPADGDTAPPSRRHAMTINPAPDEDVNALPPPASSGRSGRKALRLSVEIDPPRSIRIERTIDAARLLQAAGVDAVNISDSAMARVRMGAMAVAFGIQHDLDLECLVHFTTRDRNLMALESELLGAHALGVRNILALTGDPPRIGDYPSGTGVWDVDSIGLVEILARLNRGEDGAGSPIGAPAGFTIACALDPTAADPATEWDRLERKLAAGAHPDDPAAVRPRPGRGDGRRGPATLRAGRLPAAGPARRPAAPELPPRRVPAQRGARHHDPRRDPDGDARGRRAKGAEVGLALSLSLLAEVDHLVAGTYIMPSFGRYEQAAELVRRLRVRHAGVGVPA